MNARPTQPSDADDPEAACQAALQRLQASRQRLASELLPEPDAEPGPTSSLLRHPLQTLARWWQRHQPLDLLQDWLGARHASTVGVQAAARRTAPASLFDTAFDAAHAAIGDAGRFARRQPAAALGLAVGLGGLAYLLRRPLWRAGLAVAAVASQRTRAWVLTMATDPAIYQTLMALWLAQRGAATARATSQTDDEASSACSTNERTRPAAADLTP